MFSEIIISGKQNEIQALFIEYDFYYHYTSNIICYGRQEYPVIEEPRYITNEYDYNKQVLFIDNGINFQPAWVDCDEFDNLDYLDINYELENLFKLHSRTLLHKALDSLNIYAVVGVPQADTLMMEVFHQQHDLITFSVVGEVN